MSTAIQKITRVLEKRANERRSQADEFRAQAQTLENEADAYEELLQYVQQERVSKAALEAFLAELN